MRKFISLSAAAIGAGLLVGCASTHPIGTLYTNVKLPVAATDNSTATKVGTAECVSYLGLITTGDASIDTAKKNGGITKVSHVDWEVENTLGFIGKYKVVVYGE